QGQRIQHQKNGQANGQPVAETPAQLGRCNGIRRAADQGGHATDIGRPGNAQQHKHQQAGTGPVGLAVQQAQGQRQHHGGGGGVADPHRQGGGGQQQQQHADSQRAARQVQQAAGNPAVDTLGLQGAGQGKAAEENGDYRVG